MIEYFRIERSSHETSPEFSLKQFTDPGARVSPFIRTSLRQNDIALVRSAWDMRRNLLAQVYFVGDYVPENRLSFIVFRYGQEASAVFPAVTLQERISTSFAPLNVTLSGGGGVRGKAVQGEGAAIVALLNHQVFFYEPFGRRKVSFVTASSA